jgi:hypothetical protein
MDKETGTYRECKQALLALPRVLQLSHCEACSCLSHVDHYSYLRRKFKGKGYTRYETKMWWVCSGCEWAIRHNDAGWISCEPPVLEGASLRSMQTEVDNAWASTLQALGDYVNQTRIPSHLLIHA